MVNVLEYDMSKVEKELAVCPKYERVFHILGKRWNALIIDVLDQKECRFCEISRTIEELSDRVLTERIRELEQEQIIIKKRVSEDSLKYTYSLTQKGKSLARATRTLKRWAEEWIKTEDC